MLENFIQVKEKALFEYAFNKGDISEDAIAFIEDTKEIWAKGVYFDGSKVDLSNIPTKTSDLINDNGFISSPVIPEQDGIYAVTSDERIISLDEADETCIALALIKGPHKFWIDKFQYYSDETEIYLWDSTFNDTGIPNYTKVGGGSTGSYGYLNPDGSGLNLDYTTWEEGTALGDIKGFENSEILKTRDADYRNIGYVLNKFNAGEVGDNLGHNDWYIPACGQAALFCLHRDELNTALTKIGGTKLIKTSYWTSSEYAQRDAWYINLWDYSVGMYSSNKTKYTEFKLRLIRDIKTLDERFDNKQNTISDLALIREGAALGATAVQPEAISDMETKTNAAATYQPIGDYATKLELPTKVSQLENDSNYIQDDGSDGVYAVNANGKLIDYNTADSTAIGVALVAGEHKFMIAKANATYGSNFTLYWDKSYSDLSLTNYDNVDDNNLDGYLPKPDGTFGGYSSSAHLSDDFTTWKAGALSDFNGKTNTTVIAASSSNARDMCTVLNAFNTSDIHNDWYIPACGQLALIYLNKTEINAALAKIGGTALSDDRYWSSSERTSLYAWYVDFDDGEVARSLRKDHEGRVRFIRDISIPTLKERVSEIESQIGDINTILESIINGNTNNLITFTANSNEYQAEEGMTWLEFINSKYNDGAFTDSADLVYYNNSRLLLYGSYLTTAEIIGANTSYRTTPSSGGSPN